MEKNDNNNKCREFTEKEGNKKQHFTNEVDTYCETFDRHTLNLLCTRIHTCTYTHSLTLECLKTREEKNYNNNERVTSPKMHWRSNVHDVGSRMLCTSRMCVYHLCAYNKKSDLNRKLAGFEAIATRYFYQEHTQYNVCNHVFLYCIHSIIHTAPITP